MKFLLDQGLPRTLADRLTQAGFDSVHVGALGMSEAADTEILSHAVQDGRVVVTHDSDFHGLIAASGASDPSVIRIRIQGLKAEGLRDVVLRVIDAAEKEINAGAVVTVNETSVRARLLPLGG